jgi:glycosyltransferase involved in cell wall biosynthesis
MKVAVVSCSPFIDYVRARTLRTGFGESADTEVILVKNEKANIGRYFEVFSKLIKIRFQEKPDVYVLTFRGYEMLLATLLVAGNKPVIFDEFINPIEWLIYEKHKLRPNSLLAKIFGSFYKSLVKRSSVILADTKAHAEYSAVLNNLNIHKYQVVPVGTDEKLFHPLKSVSKKITKKTKFKVFYFGQLMTPLQGFGFILEAAVKLRETKDIEFVIIGNNKNTKQDIEKAIKLGASIKHIDWVEFNKLPNEIHKADLCLGGPFGATVQSQMVVTNKTTQFMACAKPVIVGKNKIHRIFHDGKNCLLVNQGSSQAIADKILWSYKNRRLLKSIGKNGYKTYQDNFSQKVISQACQILLDKVY